MTTAVGMIPWYDSNGVYVIHKLALRQHTISKHHDSYGPVEPICEKVYIRRLILTIILPWTNRLGINRNHRLMSSRAVFSNSYGRQELFML